MGALKKFFLLFIVALSLLLHKHDVLGGDAMEISTSAFQDGGKIPIQYVMPGAGRKNISIPLVWKNIPAGTKCFAVSIVDIHPIAQNWVHWLVINISPRVTTLEEGASNKKMPSGSIELKNSWGDIGYDGPEPPKGQAIILMSLLFMRSMWRNSI